jgi:hypothetical protein
MKGTLALKRAFATLLLGAFLVAPALADTVRPLAGNVIMARGGSTPLYVWNATPYVAQLVTDKLLGDPGLHALEATAVTALADKAKSATADTLSMRVVYEKTGAVSPIYGTPTMAGVETVVTLTAERKSLIASGAAWATQVGGGTTPAGLTLAVSGALPPAQ